MVMIGLKSSCLYSHSCPLVESQSVREGGERGERCARERRERRGGRGGREERGRLGRLGRGQGGEGRGNLTPLILDSDVIPDGLRSRPHLWLEVRSEVSRSEVMFEVRRSEVRLAVSIIR